MKHGPFILVTQSGRLLEQEIPGVINPSDLSTRYLSSACALLLDHRLDKQTQDQIVTACLAWSLPWFQWVPEAAHDSEENGFPEPLGRFLREQNHFERHLPSAQTINQLKLQSLIDIITTANSHLEPRDVMNSVMTHIHTFIICEAWSVLIIDQNEPDTLRFSAVHPKQEQLLHHKVPFGEGIAGWVAKHRQPLVVNHAQSDPRFFGMIDKDLNFVTRNILCAPLISRDRTIGVLELVNAHKKEGFSEADLELVQILVNPAAVAIDNAFLFQKTQMLAILDDLTQLFNSRHLNQSLDSELRRAKRTQTPVSLIFLDLDGFKAVNDSYGHLEGSRSLVKVGDIIKTCARETDIVGRYGGDEFMLILPETDAPGAMKVAERIRLSVEEYRMKDLQMTVSIGIATYPVDGSTKEDLIRLADKAMYQVKDQGKNGILLAADLT